MPGSPRIVGRALTGRCVAARVLGLGSVVALAVLSVTAAVAPATPRTDSGDSATPDLAHVSPRTFARQVCPALAGFRDDFAAGQAQMVTLTRALAPRPGTTEKSDVIAPGPWKDAAKQFLRQAVSGTETLRRSLRSAGTPRTRNGPAVKTVFEDHLLDLAAALRTQQRGVDALPGTRARLGRAGADLIDRAERTVRRTFAGLDPAIERVDRSTWRALDHLTTADCAPPA